MAAKARPPAALDKVRAAHRDIPTRTAERYEFYQSLPPKRLALQAAKDAAELDFLRAWLRELKPLIDAEEHEKTRELVSFATSIKAAQSTRARGERDKHSGDANAESFREITSRIARIDGTAAELWQQFFGMLETNGFVPEWKGDDTIKYWYQGRFNSVESHISFGGFANSLSKIRSKTKKITNSG